MTFNLIREPWISAAGRDGRVRLLGLAELLETSHELVEIVDESPLVVAALHRLVLAILHRNFGPRDTEAWGELWRHGRWPAGALGKYWAKWEDRFDLFDAEKPFYQSASITEEDEPRATGILIFHWASGNNATLTDHTTDQRSRAMSPAEAARALIAHQTFALGGTVGYLKSCERDSDKRASDAPSARGAICVLQGNTLFQTLMLNLAEYDSAALPGDLPCWEREPAQGRHERVPDGRADLFTWQSRRSRLFASADPAAASEVTKVKLVPGYHVPTLWNPFAVESQQSFVIKSDAKADERPWFQYRITPERAVWRDSGAILHGVDGERRRTLALDWIAQLVADGELPRDFICRVEVLGFATDQQKVRMWRREHLPVTTGLLRDGRCRESLRSALRHAEDTAFALAAATERLAAEVLSPGSPQSGSNKPDPARVKQLARSLGTETDYWSSLGLAFQDYLEALSGSEGADSETERERIQDSAFDEWKLQVRGAALGAFTRGSSGVAQQARGLRAQAMAESELRRRLKSVANKLMGNEVPKN